MELQTFFHAWDKETDGTLALLRALPADQYDLRPDSGGRSLGELAWHLAEVDAYVSLGIERRSFAFDGKPPHIERPRRDEYYLTARGHDLLPVLRELIQWGKRYVPGVAQQPPPGYTGVAPRPPDPPAARRRSR